MRTGREAQARRSMPGARRWRWAPWLALLAVGALGLSAASLRSRASAPSTRAPEEVHLSETPAPSVAPTPPGRALTEPLLAAQALPSVSPAADPIATASVAGRVVDALGG
ncbi:MAG TPA: hypothetical protein VJU61_14905, partial [Polyangiaceae bacterium]|nr:hypothetical protein [Polyangiaceae bacterium]